MNERCGHVQPTGYLQNATSLSTLYIWLLSAVESRIMTRLGRRSRSVWVVDENGKRSAVWAYGGLLR